MIDQKLYIAKKWTELVEWTAKVMTQYTITDLWTMDIVEFIKLTERARSVQKSQMSQQ